MARFYGELQGSRGKTSRLGTAKSGMQAHIRGWDIGVRIELRAIDDIDVIEVYRTNGSNRAGPDKLIGEFRALEEDSPKYPFPA